MKEFLILSAIAVFCISQGEAFNVLAFYSGNFDLAHISFVGDCQRFFPSIQSEHGFSYESTTDWGRLNDLGLANVDVVMFLDDQPWNSNQRGAFQRFIERGGGFIGYHVSAFTQDNGNWAWYHNTFLGSGDFYGNTWRPTSAVLQVEDSSHPAVARLPATFSTQPNEWYSWTNDLRRNPNINILLAIHDSSFPLGTGPNEWEIWHSGYYPVVWTNRNYNMLYVNMGHNDMNYEGNNEELSHTFESEVQNRLIIDGLKWMGNAAKKLRLQKLGPLLKALV